LRQWELIGITDQEPGWTPPKSTEFEPVEFGADEHGRSVFFWSTDESLRMRTVSRAAAETLGLPVSECLGRDLLELFGMEGPSLFVLEAHVAALEGREGTFKLWNERDAIECRVAPTHGSDERISGTFCIAIPEQASQVLDAARERVRVA
jgi:PAS domain-containing protein